jgi:hypothetical protein
MQQSANLIIWNILLNLKKNFDLVCNNDSAFFEGLLGLAVEYFQSMLPDPPKSTSLFTTFRFSIAKNVSSSNTSFRDFNTLHFFNAEQN